MACSFLNALSKERMGFLISDLNKRDLRPEIMDDLTLDASCHEKALCGLERINTLSLAAHSFWKPIHSQFVKTGQKPFHVLDIACGGGDITRRLAQKARAEKLPIIFEGCDFNPQAVDYAKRQAQAKSLSVNYFTFDALRDPIPDRFNAVMSSLFLHHLSENEIILFFKNFLASQARLLIISDLKRSWGAWLLASIATRLLSTSPVVHQDGPQSVQGALTPDEALALAHKSGLTTAQVAAAWPMRYLLTYRRS